MFTKALTIAALAAASPALSSEQSYEACFSDGNCALRVEDTETGVGIWLIQPESIALTAIWKGEFWEVSGEDYAAVLDMIPEDQRMEFRKGTPKGGGSSGGKGGGSITGGAPVIGGNITVTVGGSDSCRECHTKSMKEIHKRVLN